MKITPHLLSIPPYFTAPWSSIAALQTIPQDDGMGLLITLQNDTQVEIPKLESNVLAQIFDAYGKAVQAANTKSEDSTTMFADAMQHNSAQSGLPNLPPAVLEKLAIFVKSLGFDDASVMPTAQEGCNCVYCQLCRVMTEAPEEETVTDAELSFRDWEIAQVDGKLYKVTSPLDPNENYNVYLGAPVGCTCGQSDCEHIKAVLHS